jgi:hypothetical protein
MFDFDVVTGPVPSRAPQAPLPENHEGSRESAREPSALPPTPDGPSAPDSATPRR